MSNGVPLNLPPVSLIPRATVMPTVKPETPPDKFTQLLGGVFDESGKVVVSSLLHRNYGTVVAAAEPCEAVRHLDGDFIYVGYDFNHYGHFLLESCARLWFARQHPELPVVWGFRGAENSFKDVILNDILDLKNEQIVVREPTSFSNLYVPDPAFVIGASCSPEFIELTGQFEGSRPADRKLWLSRSKLPDSLGKIIGEQELEEQLVKSGWDIFHPQEHGLLEQLAILASGSKLAGFAGSAFHSLLLLKEFQGSVTIFRRGIINNNYRLIAEAKGFQQTIEPLEDLVLDEARHGSRTTWKLTDHQQVLRILE